MLRLIGFFVLVLACMHLLRLVPFLRPLVDIPFFGFWLCAIVVSFVIARFANVRVDRHRLARQKRALGAVDTPHNQGKLGMLLLAGKDARAAVTALEKAVAGEPDSVEWAYRLGLALLSLKRASEAVPHLERAALMDEEHAYGAVQLRLAQALLESGRPDDALIAIDRFDRNHGASPESAFRRGLALRAIGRSDEARTSLRSVAELARNAARFQRSSAREWVWRAFLARWV